MKQYSTPFQLYLIPHHGLAPMLKLARYLVTTKELKKFSGVIFQPEERTLSHLHKSPEDITLELVGQNYMVSRFCRKRDLSLYLVRTSNIGVDLHRLMQEIDLSREKYLGIFLEDSIDDVLDAINRWSVSSFPEDGPS